MFLKHSVDHRGGVTPQDEVSSWRQCSLVWLSTFLHCRNSVGIWLKSFSLKQARRARMAQLMRSFTDVLIGHGAITWTQSTTAALLPLPAPLPVRSHVQSLLTEQDWSEWRRWMCLHIVTLWHWSTHKSTPALKTHWPKSAGDHKARCRPPGPQYELCAAHIATRSCETLACAAPTNGSPFSSRPTRTTLCVPFWRHPSHSVAYQQHAHHENIVAVRCNEKRIILHNMELEPTPVHDWQRRWNTSRGIFPLCGNVGKSSNRKWLSAMGANANIVMVGTNCAAETVCREWVDTSSREGRMQRLRMLLLAHRQRRPAHSFSPIHHVFAWREALLVRKEGRIHECPPRYLLYRSTSTSSRCKWAE